jgi:glycosyltransferase involved in cell wall biosynthesis
VTALRLLVLSFYYYPDLSAGSFRTTALVHALRERAPPGTHIDLVTTLPNRYGTFAPEAAQSESGAGFEIWRIPLPPHRSDMAGQSRAFAAYAAGARKAVAGRSYDLVFATSSRLMTAVLGAWLARRAGARLYLDIRDIFVDTISQLLPRPAAAAARLVLAPLESWAVRRADRVNLVSPGFEGYFRERYGALSFAGFTNGIDEEFLDVARAEPRRTDSQGPATVVYAGNIGEGQALHLILPQLARALRKRARFIVVGDGGRRQALADALARAGVDNVEMRLPLPRAALIEVYEEAQVLLLHLGPQEAFEKVLPSKVFEYAALGKPLLAGVAGYAARFIRAEIDNAAVFAPCDADGAVQAFASLRLADRPRSQFVAKYRRANIAATMADDVLAVARDRLMPASAQPS